MRTYRTARSITSSGEPISSSSGRASATPMIISSTPPARDSSTEVCTVSETARSFREPV